MHESLKVVKGLGYVSEFLASPRWSRKAQISEKYYLYFLSFKVLLRSKFNVKFVTKTLSFQLIRSGCTCFGHWSELWRPLSENIELENVGFSRPPLQIYVPVTKLLFSDCDVIFWTRQENKTWNVRKLRAILKASLVFARFWNCEGGNRRLHWLCRTSTDWIWESQILWAATKSYVMQFVPTEIRTTVCGPWSACKSH